jgi:hypothetical protein
MLTHTSGIRFQSHSKLFKYDNKIYHPHPFVVGLSGNIDVCLEVLSFFDGNPDDWSPPKGMRGQEFVVLTANHRIFTFTRPDKWLPVNADYYAIGTGSNFALGAMMNGATPLEAVKIAAKADAGTGMGFTHYEFD